MHPMGIEFRDVSSAHAARNARLILLPQCHCPAVGANTQGLATFLRSL